MNECHMFFEKGIGTWTKFDPRMNLNIGIGSILTFLVKKNKPVDKIYLIK